MRGSLIKGRLLHSGCEFGETGPSDGAGSGSPIRRRLIASVNCDQRNEEYTVAS